MSRWTPLFFSFFLAACSGSSSDGAVVDGGDSGTDGTADGVVVDSAAPGEGGDTGLDAPPPPDTACTDCIGASLTWGNTGGFTAYDDTSALAPCKTYTRTREHHDVDAGTQGCTTEVAACGASDVVGLSQIESALAHPDAVAAFAAAPVLYGRDTRPVDGSVFQITYGGRTVTVGQDCGSASPCTPIPAGVQALETVLQNLDFQELSKDPCVAVFGHPGGP
jgi:hypothetical protein